MSEISRLKQYWSEMPEEGGGAHYHCCDPVASPQDEIPAGVKTKPPVATGKPAENTSRYGEGFVVQPPVIPCF